MDTLKSASFKGDRLLEAALNNDVSHIIPGAQGDHVLKLQSALEFLLPNPPAGIAEAEMTARRYGPTTSAAVLRFKTENRIINFAYQTRPDNIVGKMTMKALDEAMLRVPPPSDPKLQQVGAAIVLTLFRMDAAMGPDVLTLSPRVRLRLEALRVAAALASRGNLTISGNIRVEYNRGSSHLAAIGFARPPIVFAAVPLVAAGAGITALEIAIAALALILLLCIVSEDFRNEVSRLANEALEAAAESTLSAIQEASIVRSQVRRCNQTNPNPSPKCKERQNEFDDKDRDFAGKQKEATKAIADAIIRLLQISEIERRALLVKVKDALVKLEQALKALKDAANALFKDCGCLIKPF
jgi:hypothetical protein